MAQHHITNLTDLKSRVRDKTLYEDSPQELTDAELESNIHDAMLRLEDSAGVTNFYADVGLQRTILYASCIEAKAAIENYSVSSWNVGAGTIDVSGAGDSDQFQFEHWAENVASGLSSSDHADSGSTATSINSTNFIH